MKLLFLLLAMGSSLPESRVDRYPQSNTSYPGCDAREVSTGILANEKTPRDVLYHYGKKELLLKMLNPEATWNDLTKDDNDSYILKRFRNGFYGTEYAEDADAFGDLTHPWLVEIKLKPECLKPSRITSLVYLPKNSAFQKWYESKLYPDSFDHWKSICFDATAYPRSKYFMDYKKANEAGDLSETICEKIVADYYEEQKFSFVQDHAGDLVRSWAIRDRGCVASVEGTDAYWSTELAMREEFWVNRCKYERNHRNNVRVWFSAMESSGVEVDVLKKFSTMIKNIPAPEDRLDWQTQEMDRFAAQDFADSLWSASKRCALNSKEFRHALGEISKIVDQLQSSEVKMKLESLCR